VVITWAIATSQCPHTSATYDFVAGASVIPATATKTKAEGGLVLRKNDASTCAGTWKLKVSPFTVIPCACASKISSAGQGKTKAQ
jgi:hypothetical protein